MNFCIASSRLRQKGYIYRDFLHMNSVIKYILTALGLLVLVLAIWYFKNVVAYVLIAAILSLIGRPIVDFLQKAKIKKWRMPKSISAIIALLVIWVVFFSFFRRFIPLIAQQANELSGADVGQVVEQLQVPLENVEKLFRQYNTGNGEVISLEDYVSEKIGSVLDISLISNIFGTIAGLLGDIFIALFAISFITFFFLKDDKMLVSAILLTVPSRFEENVAHALASVKRLLTRYFVGIIIQISCIIVLITIGLSIAGLNFRHALVIGLVVGLMNVIPYIGPVIGAIFGIIMGIATHLDIAFTIEILPLLGFMLVVFISVQVIDNILFQPLIYSSSVHAHPLEIFLVIMIAGSLAGIPGMILAIPVYTILRVFGKEFFNNFKVVKKLTENIH